MRSTKRTYRYYLTVTVSAGMVSIAQTSLGANQAQLSLTMDPPLVKTATVTLLDNPKTEGNARLDIEYIKDIRLTPKITISLEQGNFVIRDDGTNGDLVAGDLKYTAIIPLDVKAIISNQQRIALYQNQQINKLTMPVYANRRKVTEIALPTDYLIQPRANIAFPVDYFALTRAVDPERSLVIRDPNVVTDTTRTYDSCSGNGTPNGRWTFGNLMTQMANPTVTGIDPTEFVTAWMNENLRNQTVNGWTVYGNANLRDFYDGWPKLPDGRLDISRSPFKLIAIVNRTDLRNNPVYSGRDAGEARFVFQSNCVNGRRIANDFTVIFEYGIVRRSCGDVRSWARQWTGLRSYSIGSAEYRTALQAITDQFTLANAAPAKPNGSAINQVRMNLLPSFLWQLREFRLHGEGSPAALVLATVAQTPDSSVSGTSLDIYRDTPFSNYVNEFATDIINSRHRVPLEYAGVHFLGGDSERFREVNPWNSLRILNREARHMFALNTCVACHSSETGQGDLSDFFHISAAAPGMPATLSGFMTGINVPDPFDGTPTRYFNELERRSTDLDGLANNLCVYNLNNNVRVRGMLTPLRMSH